MTKITLETFASLERNARKLINSRNLRPRGWSPLAETLIQAGAVLAIGLGSLGFLGGVVFPPTTEEALFSVGRVDSQGEAWVEDYNLTASDCAAWVDDDPQWRCWQQAGAIAD